MSMKNSNDTIGNRTRDLPACSAVPQPTLLNCNTENIPVIGSHKYLPRGTHVVWPCFRVNSSIYLQETMSSEQYQFCGILTHMVKAYDSKPVQSIIYHRFSVRF
jgi:hypothetical protein